MVIKVATVEETGNKKFNVFEVLKKAPVEQNGSKNTCNQTLENNPANSLALNPKSRTNRQKKHVFI